MSQYAYAAASCTVNGLIINLSVISLLKILFIFKYLGQIQNHLNINMMIYLSVYFYKIYSF
jgi:hypothetical protein